MIYTIRYHRILCRTLFLMATLLALLSALPAPAAENPSTTVQLTGNFIFWAVTCTFGILLLLVTYWNHVLRKTIHSRTFSLQQELEGRIREQTEELKTSEENYRHISGITSDFVHKCTRKGTAPFRIQWAGGRVQDITGYTAEEICTKGCWLPFVHPVDRQDVNSHLFSLVPGDRKTMEFRLVTKQGDTRWISETTHCIRGESEGQLILFGASRDITEQKETEEKLLETQELFGLFMRFTPVYTFIKRIEGNQSRVIQLSDNFIDMVDRPAEELRGRTMEEMFPADFARKITDDDISVINKGNVIQLDEELNGRSYTTIKFPILREGKESLLAGFTIDITSRKDAESKLQASDNRLRRSQRIANIGCWELNVATGELYWSDEIYRIFDIVQDEFGANYEAFLNTIHPDDRSKVNDAYQNSLNNRTNYSIDHRLLFPDGRIKWVHEECENTYDDSGKPLFSLGTVQDITGRKISEDERLKLEQQLLHTQKLESLGILAGGIAHDFNNILTAIIGNADLALLRLNPESPALENLHHIEKAASRAADLARQMLAYSGRGKFVVEAIDLNRLLEEMGHMLEVSISKKAVLRYNLTHPLPTVDADAAQIRQIIMNLVINSSEAIGEKSGVIAISTGCLQCDENYLQRGWLTAGHIPAGLYVLMEITDTGCGMDKETLGKIFDPFFTTKFIGRGLGMAAMLGIVRGHKGAIKVYSEPQKGTTFKVLLPASGRPAEFSDGETHMVGWKGEGKVLLVDDEETVRGIGSEMLKELGFTPILAVDGREAVAIFKDTPDIAFVILDLTMPHMDGEQCFRELRQLDPQIKVIMSSGFSEHEITQRFAGEGLAGFIQKPYKLSKLSGILRNLDTGAS